jgi:hypothetical protein
MRRQNWVGGVARMLGLLGFLAIAGVGFSKNSNHPTTDSAKVADAFRAGPPFITKNATILDWPQQQGGEYRILRKGTNEWTCLPGVPGYSHDEPGCFDPVFMQWIKDSLAGHEPHITTVGIAYMYVGAWVPNKSGKVSGSDEFHEVPLHHDRESARKSERSSVV